MVKTISCLTVVALPPWGSRLGGSSNVFGGATVQEESASGRDASAWIAQACGPEGS